MVPSDHRVASPGGLCPATEVPGRTRAGPRLVDEDPRSSAPSTHSTRRPSPLCFPGTLRGRLAYFQGRGPRGRGSRGGRRAASRTPPKRRVGDAGAQLSSAPSARPRRLDSCPSRSPAAPSQGASPCHGASATSVCFLLRDETFPPRTLISVGNIFTNCPEIFSQSEGGT